MAQEEVLSNINYFFEVVIPEAINSGQWPKESVDRAFFWADYCQEIYIKSKDHPKREALNSAIKALHNNGDVSSNMSLEYLKISTEVLLWGFLQNKTIGTSTLQLVYEKGHERGFDMDQLTKEHNEVCSLTEDILTLFTDTLTSETIGMSVVSQVEAEYLIDDIRKEIVSHSSKHETEEWLLDFVKKMCRSSSEMEILLHILLIKSESFSAVSDLQRFLLSYLCQRIAVGHHLFDSIIATRVWQQPAMLLRSLSLKHFLFYKHYINTLVTCSLSMKLELENDVPVWKAQDSENIVTFTFEELVLHFSCLCKVPDEVASATETMLQSQVQNSKDNEIWEHIKSRLRTGSFERA